MIYGRGKKLMLLKKPGMPSPSWGGRRAWKGGVPCRERREEIIIFEVGKVTALNNTWLEV
jgi:hypothetical protein